MGLPARQDEAKPPVRNKAPTIGRPVTLADVEERPRELYPDEEERLEDFQYPASKAWMRSYAKLGTAAAASRDINMSESVHRYWRDQDPAFREMYEDMTHAINERWDAYYEHLALHGYKETLYNKDGDLAGQRIKQDPGTVKQIMQARMAKYRNDGGSNEINVVIQVNSE